MQPYADTKHILNKVRVYYFDMSTVFHPSRVIPDMRVRMNHDTALYHYRNLAEPVIGKDVQFKSFRANRRLIGWENPIVCIRI